MVDITVFKILNVYFCCCSSRKVPAGVDHVLLKCYVWPKNELSCAIITLVCIGLVWYSWQKATNTPCILMSWKQTLVSFYLCGYLHADLLPTKASIRDWCAALVAICTHCLCRVETKEELPGCPSDCQKKPTYICFMSHQIKCSAQHILVFSTLAAYWAERKTECFAKLFSVNSLHGHAGTVKM